jgi:hypothetical protein
VLERREKGHKMRQECVSGISGLLWAIWSLFSCGEWAIPRRASLSRSSGSRERLLETRAKNGGKRSSGDEINRATIWKIEAETNVANTPCATELKMSTSIAWRNSASTGLVSTTTINNSGNADQLNGS